MKKPIALSLCAVLALSGCAQSSASATASAAPTATAVTADETKTADVIIVGAGGGGMSAAISAVDNGAKSVIIIEKTTQNGGSLNYTSGSMSGAETVIQQIDGVEDTVDSYVSDIMANGDQKGNEALIREYAEEDINAIQWLWDNGLSDNKFSTDKATGTMSVFAPEHQLYSVKRTYKASPDDSEKYKSAAHEILDTVLSGYDQVEVDYSTEAYQLVYNDQNQVMSVLAKSGNKTIEYTAEKGVIMATGGYSGNQSLMAAFTENGGYYLPGGASTADDYGIYMMQEAGAYIDSESMSYVPTFPMGLDTGSGPGKIASTYMWKTGGICVNQDGQRFINETESEVVTRETALEEQPQAVQYDIFTDQIIADAEANNSSVFWNYYYAPGKPYNQYVIEADSLEDLADQIGVPADTLKTTVESYNSHVTDQTEDEFGRQFTADSLDGTYNVSVNTIEGDKYYAVPLHALCVMTLGGVSINSDAQVLDNDQNPIPGLYAVGECVGNLWGKYVSGGTGVMGPIVFGRIAGKAIMNNTVETSYQPTASDSVIDAALFETDDSASAVTFDMSTALTDGTYTASVDGQEGTLSVEVTIKDGKINDVQVTEAHESSFTSEAQKTVPEEIVSSNSLEVDNVTGATLTSTRIKEAVKDCLTQASK
ncbi:MAG: FAD-binding protein [Solobacterium sp.]|jgi:flavocytochrome c|nr:FAD-binding protein [Solobacterium sp.]MCH4265962.1 FAD-binding protein [Solobacterium sp.]